MSSDINWIALDRYFSGECTAAEAAVVERWAAAEPARADELEAARLVWREAGVVRKRFDVAAARATVHARMAEPTPIRPPRFDVGSGTRRWAIAAGLAAVLGAGLVWRAVERAAPVGQALAAATEHRTARGERAEFRLADGTRVMLGPESRLAVSAAYGTDSREVELEGQAYFEVVHDERRPFAVRAKDAIARDLGTRFDVRAYRGEAGVRVVVAEGKVALGSRSTAQDVSMAGQVLAANQIGELRANGQVAVRTNVNVATYLGWTSGHLVFEDTPLVDALPELNRWYNLDFRLGDSSLAHLPLTGTLEDRPTAATLDLLAIALGVKVERRGGTVILSRIR